MNVDIKVGSSGGIGFVGLLTILFIFLKLMGIIDWAWLWVLSPIWITFVLVMAIIIICLIIIGTKGIFKHWVLKR